jgi:hypothetical protein
MAVTTVIINAKTAPMTNDCIVKLPSKESIKNVRKVSTNIVNKIPPLLVLI